jgi:drug/metabolite transporter (DMT)-like permease
MAPKNLSADRRGEFLIFSEASLWSLFPIITVLSLRSITPLASLAWSTACSGLFFGILMGFRHRWKELKDFSALKDILYTAVHIGFLYYAFYFFGLKYTTPGNASLIALTEVLFTFIFFGFWKKEYIAPRHMAGAAFMVLGAAIVILPGFRVFNPGDILVLIGMIFAPMGNYFSQRARSRVSSETIMFVRSIIVFPCVLLLAHFLRQGASPSALRSSWFFLAINGVILFGLSKLLWLDAIHYIPVPKAIALASIAPLLTLLLSWLILRQAPTSFQLVSFFPLAFGVFLLTREKPVRAA